MAELGPQCLVNNQSVGTKWVRQVRTGVQYLREQPRIRGRLAGVASGLGCVQLSRVA